MAIRVALNHVTTYKYDRLVNIGPQTVRLRPAPHSRTPILSYSLRVSPKDHFVNWQQDPQSNYLARLIFAKRAKELRVEVDLVADMTVINPFSFFVEDYAMNTGFTYEKTLLRELRPYMELGDSGPLLLKFMTTVERKDERNIDFLVALNQRLQNEIKYVIRMEPGVQTCEETLGGKLGSCRDSAWLLVNVLRHYGLAARFVSGYLIQLAPDMKSLDGPSGPVADFTDLHAWTEVFLPGAGWVGLDPTSGLLCSEGHIPLAAAAEPSSAAPIDGLVDECEVELDVKMTITRIHEDPRVTKPYTEEQWTRIVALGERIDQDLKRGDVRLTMGGEPTFVSVDDMDGEEWNTTALGPRKRILANQLLHRMKDHFAENGLLHHGQGKWYPGEPLPRWAFSCFWRRDGEPMWNNKALWADEKINYNHDAATAKAFITGVAEALGVKPEHAIPGYEDVFYYLWKERRLPINVDPFDSKLSNKQERDRLSALFERGLDTITGYALMLSKGWQGFGPAWISGDLFLRSERMHLIPGDSPMGFRLPLDSVPYSVEGDRAVIEDQDPLAPRTPLATNDRQMVTDRAHIDSSKVTAREEVIEQSLSDKPLTADQVAMIPSAPELVRTALCVEPRKGTLHIFFPPVRTLEDYLEIVAACELTAERLGTPIFIEGYKPPPDPRLDNFGITPDPGVIEVNVHPVANWSELVTNTNFLYDEARLARLCTEKFMLDGRHTGTGGGNHVVMGGPTPSDSPFLRRPDLLRSLLGYWHNHPALSYLFSGMFIGPTSQAPRVDEARNDAIYELDIAFKQIPDFGGVKPWFVDRVFRNLLVDVTGNTHRSEFCIDKLYSPDSASGRLGLVEFRAFEMPPHARMSLTQQLLLRALVARFWREPYRQPLVRWGTELHDRFMLPHFISQDFRDVIEDNKAAGYPMEEAWFAPHLEFRFPQFGTIQHLDMRLEIRQAIEPWLVLGEEPAGGSTVRFVDSSIERVQVKIGGFTNSRHVLLCNGRAVPLHNTGTIGEYVAGVRYRAWQPPTCLHPTIPVHAPLVFDLADRWNNRSVGGCTYHVAHPGGESYLRFPVNAYEAEARRHGRFFPYGHTPGPMMIPKAEINPEFPFTLDLRH